MNQAPPVSPRRPRKAVVALGLAVPLLLGLLVVEVGARLLLQRPGFSVANREGSSGLLVELPDSPRQYGYQGGIERSVGEEPAAITVQINERGFRDASWEPLELGGVLAVGNSFTAGWGVDQEEGWPQRLESGLSDSLGPAAPSVYNAGVSGYSLRQIRSTAEELLPLLEPRVVVVAVFASRAGRIDNPYVVVGENLVRSSVADRIVPVEGGFLSPAWGGILGRVESFCDRWCHFGSHVLRALAPKTSTPESAPEEFVKPLLAELVKLQTAVEEYGADLWVVQVVTQDEDGGIGAFEGRYSQLVGKWCADAGVPCLDSGPLLASASDGGGDMRLGADRHWSAHAHDLVAAELGERFAALYEANPTTDRAP